METLRHIKTPDDPLGFKVTITPKGLLSPCWSFYVMLKKDDQDEAEQIIREICQSILDAGDHFSCRMMIPEDEEDESFMVVPIMAYNVDTDEFEWLVAPTHWKN